MNSSKNKILVILGPTSSGKSDIAIKMAKKFNGEIISADSRQIFRGMDIGTGKVTGKLTPVILSTRSAPKDLATKKIIFLSHGIPHHMIDIVSPQIDFNVAKFKKQSEKIIDDILKRGKLPIICGGTGFWIQSIVDDVNFPEVKPDWKLRKKLERYSAEKLFTMLKKLDSARSKNIDSKNKVRLIRAIEIAIKIGKVPKIKNKKYQILNTRYQILQIGLKLPKEKLYLNIEKRVLARFKQGMIAEVEKLHQQGLSWKKIQSFGLAYLWIPLYLQNKISKKELVEKVTQAEKNYAKRQMTWFKRDKRIKWLKNYQQIEKSVKIFLK
ncbi:MAG: tRNA delta(2)-isopentenylpyrophosphate transferase, tRNA dimethylallyltransferase [Candidatus Moranbacteria bacterium GW2011_GWC1_45_18]|nr:MAG: tRNA dimethylallyltransferase [Candidatus Moranbacteria bacterium GW2011_GWC2_40_12]KKT71364.1 MAG: tRNA dimethylallyltransferase [Candidatus Moranbacteria bacterium GW2011_GWF1_44_4]KKT99557.1 MAG: tRNA delta(2)-isopentenylpyrophosphate transferase, tRNA dimethylallyltransferase [Candidatus Moranbacteria bacterium GW2011_GWC1_45_18]OGI37009.1 MAG: tRNA (adenosine(37)-N6)-dimethylallyltransferase MiaA [Candidatus Moranbacteria bacterium RIFOXYC1_FULL_44_8]OGI39664.1 MAG: tRNA (adenosine